MPKSGTPTLPLVISTFPGESIALSTDSQGDAALLLVVVTHRKEVSAWLRRQSCHVVQ